ncbi:MAG: cytochrome c oxidase assembly protein [Alphaproteobacteria bacterium]|nr:cytochrome c oxidase assembly protein [Alphaproteobacteria bacterium]
MDPAGSKIAQTGNEDLIDESGKEGAVTPIPYCGPAPAPGDIWMAWNLDAVLIATLALAAWLVRSRPLPVQIGLGVLALAYVSPICALSAGLFSARSVHHLLIVFGAAPLLVGAVRLPKVPLSAAFAASVIVFWAWHVPAIYQWALASDAAYWLGQAALLATSVLFWQTLLRRDTSAPAAFFTLIAMVMQMGLLGALITFAPDPLYAPHYLTTLQYGISPLEDQQLAGLIMWVGSLPLSLLAGWAVLARALRRFQTAAA